MSKVDDGGPAFPSGLAATTNANGEPILYDSGERCAGGMALRDYFAAKAMQAIVGSYRQTMRGVDDCQTDADADLTSPDLDMILDKNGVTREFDGSKEIASNSYIIADAMLAARKAQQ